ncbi:hypothetical protein WME91_46505 [Sorangium sp. So ce269]
MSHLRKYEKRYEQTGPITTPGSVYDDNGKVCLENAHNIDVNLIDRTASVSFETAAAQRDGVTGDRYIIKVTGGLQYKGTLKEIHGPLGDGRTYRWWLDNVNLDHSKLKW